MQNKHENQSTGAEEHKPEITVEVSDNKVIINLEHIFHGHSQPVCDDGVIPYYLFKVDEHPHEVRERHILCSTILALAGKDPKHYQLLQLKGKPGHVQHEVIETDEMVDLATPGVEKFITRDKPVHVYNFFIDQQEHHTKHPSLTVRQILEDFAKVNPVNKELAKKQPGGLHHYRDLNEVVSVEHCPKFTLFDLTPAPVS